MSAKFYWRTLRNLLFRNRPYFAHLAITHVCNLRCSFCHIPEEVVQEQDTEGMKRIIDKLDRMGIAVLSVSGGGEPLLRKDFATLLNYAAEKGLYTKITSNGTMPHSKYQELLDSGITEIGISLDGVRGNNLPFSHVGPKVLDSIRYLNDHLPRGKKLTLNITISHANRDQVDDIVEYCTREFPHARLWLNPVVVGQGKLRVLTELKVNPDYMRRVDSPTLLTPGFYKQGAEEYYRNETYNWGCLAGELFFDIKPNGDFWICQDHPAKTPLNILAPDFERKYREADFGHRRQCSGCTYSCYWITQKSFEPKNWVGLAGMWWKVNTRPGEPCRKTANEKGWLAGLAHFSASRLFGAGMRKAKLALWLGLLATLAAAPSAQAETPPASGPHEEIITQMERRNDQRQKALRSYHNRRRYFATNSRLQRQAFLVVQESYTAPTQKQFRVIERGGSRAIERFVFMPLLETELTNNRDTSCGAVDLCRRNYNFTFEMYDATMSAYIFQVTPKRLDKYLLRGKIWVNVDDFGIRRIEGEPAEEPSFWVRRTRFTHEYAKFGDFWFPVSHRAEIELLLFGRATLGVDYFGYDWQPKEGIAPAAPSAAIQLLPLTTVSARQKFD